MAKVLLHCAGCLVLNFGLKNQNIHKSLKLSFHHFLKSLFWFSLVVSAFPLWHFRQFHFFCKQFMVLELPILFKNLSWCVWELYRRQPRPRLFGLPRSIIVTLAPQRHVWSHVSRVTRISQAPQLLPTPLSSASCLPPPQATEAISPEPGSQASAAPVQPVLGSDISYPPLHPGRPMSILSERSGVCEIWVPPSLSVLSQKCSEHQHLVE